MSMWTILRAVIFIILSWSARGGSDILGWSSARYDEGGE
jgi:hypothetical protein